MPIRPLALAIALVAGLALPAAAAQWASAYTSHDYAKCGKAKPDEDDVAVHRCIGQAGIAVVWTAGDDASAVGFGTRPTDETIIPEVSFFEAGKTIEWRGPAGARPQAAILRYATGRRIGKLDGSRLVVYRLGADGTSCIIGSVDARKPGANAAARRLADMKAAGFRCGQDARSDD